ncbi:hypothetical protein V6N13_096260 [Hibiscus sabdariffa]|uniref:DUF7722 domain-containing protein n=1 Tax=Hibiscus sabdariffa TaxID=183260 RepID=A0ABR2DG87_9ROSI
MSETSCPKALDMANENCHQARKTDECCYFRMPEWQLACPLHQYGFPVIGDVNQKRKFAMGAYLPLAFKARDFITKTNNPCVRDLTWDIIDI